MSSTADQTKRPNFGRRIKWLGITTVVVFALYSAGWFYVAQEGKRRVDLALALLSKSGTPATCEQSEIKGFPFRLGLFCKAVKFEQPQRGFVLSAGALRSAAQVYDPKHIIIEIDGPAQLDVPELAPLVFNWNLLHASARISRPLPERVSLEAKALQVTVRRPAGADTSLITADYAAGHMRKEENSIALAGEAAAVIIDPAATPGRVIPEFAASYDLVLNDGVSIFAAQPKSLRGLSATVRKSQINFTQGGVLKLNGPIKVDEAGLINADFSIALNDPAKLGIALSRAAPKAADMITNTMTTAATIKSADAEIVIEIKIRKSKVMLGFFPLGEIPPVQ